jgi:hypothetical protein
VVENIHSVTAVDESTVSLSASCTAGSEKGQAELTDACCSEQSTTAGNQALLQCVDEII